jgi:hypothetical protein
VGYSGTTAQYNTFIGGQSGYTISSGAGNTIVGFQSGNKLTTGSRNTFVGGSDNTTNYGAGYFITTGNSNTVLGCYNGNQGGLDIRTASNTVVLSDGDGNIRYYNSGTNHFFGNGTSGAGVLVLQDNAANNNGPLLVGRTGGFASPTDVWFAGSNSAIKGGTAYTTYTVMSASGGVNLTSGATAWTSASDARLKNITGTYTNALADIAQIEAVKFTWKSDAENKPQVGVIAQSVQAVVPEAIDLIRVSKDDETEYLSVKYTELIPLMIASIQALKAEIDQLKGNV